MTEPSAEGFGSNQNLAVGFQEEIWDLSSWVFSCSSERAESLVVLVAVVGEWREEVEILMFAFVLLTPTEISDLFTLNQIG